MTKLLSGTGETDARLVSTDGDPAAQGFRLVREWPFQDASQMESIYVALLATATVTDPDASGKEGTVQEYTGTFVVSDVSGREDALRQGTIRQTLVKVVEYSGEVTPNLPAEGHARLVRNHAFDPDSTIPGTRLIREWTHVNPANSEDSLTLLRTVGSYSGPQAYGVTYAGTWVNSEVESVRQQDNSDTIRQTLTLSSADTDEGDARFVSYNGDPDSDEAGAQLVREWRYIIETSADTLIVSLNAVESYSGPLAEGQVYAGTWANSRVQSIAQDDKTVTLRQTLTRTTSDTAEGDAVLVSERGDPQVGAYTIVREWRYLLDTAADTLFTTLNGVASYTDPEVDGQTMTGTFSHVTSEPQKQADRTVTIRQTLRKVHDLTTGADQAATLVLLQAVPPRIQRETVKVNEENDAHSWNASREVLTLTYENVTSGSNDVLMDDGDAKYITDANLETEADDNADNQVWQLVDRQFNHTSENVANFVCRFVDPDFNAYNSGNLKQTGLGDKAGFNNSGVGTTKLTEIRGVDSDSVETIVSSSIAAESEYVIQNISASVQGGELVVRVNQLKTDDYDDGPVGAGSVTAPIEVVQQNNVRRKDASLTFTWFLVSEDRIAAVRTQAKLIDNYTNAAKWNIASSGYVVNTVRTRYHKNGSADIIANLIDTDFTIAIDSYVSTEQTKRMSVLQTSHIGGDPGTDRYRWTQFDRVTKLDDTFTEAQSHQAARPTKTTMRNGIRTMRLANGFLVFQSYYDTWISTQAWTTEPVASPP